MMRRRLSPDVHQSASVSCLPVARQRSGLGGLPLRFGFCGVASALSAAGSEQGQHHPKPGSTWSRGATRPHYTVHIFKNNSGSNISHALFWKSGLMKQATNAASSRALNTDQSAVNAGLRLPRCVLQRPPSARGAADRISWSC